MLDDEQLLPVEDLVLLGRDDVTRDSREEHAVSYVARASEPVIRETWADSPCHV